MPESERPAEAAVDVRCPRHLLAHCYICMARDTCRLCGRRPLHLSGKSSSPDTFHYWQVTTTIICASHLMFTVQGTSYTLFHFQIHIDILYCTVMWRTDKHTCQSHYLSGFLTSLCNNKVMWSDRLQNTTHTALTFLWKPTIFLKEQFAVFIVVYFKTDRIP